MPTAKRRKMSLTLRLRRQRTHQQLCSSLAGQWVPPCPPRVPPNFSETIIPAKVPPKLHRQAQFISVMWYEFLIPQGLF